MKESRVVGEGVNEDLNVQAHLYDIYVLVRSLFWRNKQQYIN